MELLSLLLLFSLSSLLIALLMFLFAILCHFPMIPSRAMQKQHNTAALEIGAWKGDTNERKRRNDGRGEMDGGTAARINNNNGDDDEEEEQRRRRKEIPIAKEQKDNNTHIGGGGTEEQMPVAAAAATVPEIVLTTASMKVRKL